MHNVIDTPWKTTTHLPALRAGGVRTIIRYFNHRNSNRLPEKRIEADEARAIAEEGLMLCTVFQQRGGAGGNIQDLDPQNGHDDASRAQILAERIGQPHGSGIFFAVDHDYYRAADLASIRGYFDAVANVLGGDYRVGVYGSGTVARTVLDAGTAKLVWLAAARGWSGTRDLLNTSDWALFQKWPPVSSPLAHDGNTVSPAWPDYGQFTPGHEGEVPSHETPNVVLAEVVARSGLNMRRGPGTQYAVERTLEFGTIVHALDKSGDWVQIDIDGDGRADGHVHGNYLSHVSGGFPIASEISNESLLWAAPTPPTPPTPATPATPPTPMITLSAAGSPSPYQVAKAELALDVREVPGLGNNPRIVSYHNSTGAAAGNDDAVAWCSSFVNYCVEQAGMIGTDSQWALDWNNWGQDVSDSPHEGDIAVFERVGQGGHVGFVVEDLPDHVKVLGGNQSNRVKISVYPKDGQLGSFQYRLRSYRRA